MYTLYNFEISWCQKDVAVCTTPADTYIKYIITSSKTSSQVCRTNIENSNIMIQTCYVELSPSAETVAFILVKKKNAIRYIDYIMLGRFCRSKWFTPSESLAHARMERSYKRRGRGEIHHFHELFFFFFFTSVMPYPETTTQVFNLFLVKPCLENLWSS